MSGVYKRGSKWVFVIDEPRDPKEPGKRKQRWYSGYPTRKEAQAARLEVLSRIKDSIYVRPSRQTFGEYLEDWLHGIRLTVRTSTWQSYDTNLRVHVIPALGSYRLQAVTPALLNKLYADLLIEGKRSQKPDETPKGLSSRTVRYIHMIVRKALQDAVRGYELARNPADAATPPSPSRSKAPEMKTWSVDELRAFLNHVRDDRLYALWLLLAMTGMRRGEALGLRWEDVDFARSRVAIRRALVLNRYKLEWSEPKTARSRRLIWLDEGTVEALLTHRRLQSDERALFGPAYQENENAVFCREDGELLNPDRVSKMFGLHVAESAVQPIRLHDLRHTHATLALQAGINPKVVSERLGHASAAFTLDVYSHAVPGMQEEAAAQVAALLA